LALLGLSSRWVLWRDAEPGFSNAIVWAPIPASGSSLAVAYVPPGIRAAASGYAGHNRAALGGIGDMATEPSVRPTAKQNYLAIAAAVGERADCLRRRIGAVVVVDDRIVSAGRNGTEYRGQPSCFEGACPRGQLTAEQLPHGALYEESGCHYVHAELNALEWWRFTTGRHHKEGWAQAATVYISSEPCEPCQKYAAWAGCTLVWSDQ